MDTNRPIIIRPFEGIDDWYRVEWLDHDGSEWMEKGEHGIRCCSAARLDPYTCVEGCGYEMVAICEAILAGEPWSSRRCAVEIRGDEVGFHSPRNSHGRIIYVPRAVAVAAAKAFLPNMEKP